MTKTTEYAPRVMQLAVSQDSPEVARMTIYGDVSSGIDWDLLLTGEPSQTKAMDVVQALSALPEGTREVEVHINSYGGEVAEGVAIYNALRASGREVTTVCDGFACSIASVVFMAGSRRVMRPASMLMLHNPSMGAHGTSAQLRKQADDLDAICELSKTAYLAGGGIDAEELAQVMDAETWVSPEQALEWGLATEVLDGADDADNPTQHAAQAIMAALTGNAPVQAKEPEPTPAPAPAPKDPEPASAPEPTPEPTLMQHLKTMLSEQ